MAEAPTRARGATSLAHLELAGGSARIVLDRPGRGNALIPELLHQLRAAIAAARDAAPRALVLAAKGRAFSAGGDVAAFQDHARTPEGLAAYAQEIVGLLNQAILDLLSFPAPVIAAVNGATTGGAAGFVLAADMVVMSREAFLQPYYGVMGFAPDGGWTALLPERIGTARALEVQYLNTRLSAEACEALGLASRVCTAERLDSEVRALVAELSKMDAGSLGATRAAVWTPARRARVAEALERERQGFLSLIGRPETLARMAEFTSARRA
ncbi:enoyl-CoA hydratase/isomerase family protein [Stappia sp.]|jgi:2-(1,2-epoxy-1,2-dihydrophenyl)acetyl-CoA isomerase|uniref:enoyl-CoA hydratase/isomerase family protein n=1 Tax=Stappia sp. TaxID=1870903 RepID=UPI003A999205